ncbi:MAG: DNA oxidative demethylase AlkB [Dokdonella sp.]
MIARAAPTTDLFLKAQPVRTRGEKIVPGASLLRGFASSREATLLRALADVIAAAPLRHMLTPGGFRMSVAMTNCGEFGWLTDRRGYRYERLDPLTAKKWPTMPDQFADLANHAAAAAGYDDFVPDACLVNRYEPGARMALHQDKDERDHAAPIVSVSLGLPATFLFGGEARADPHQRIPLQHGDVVVWGGPARMRFHGVLPLKDGHHALLGAQRINLTLRRAN